MDLNATLSNWLQIKVVYDARPNDLSAKDTYDFFTQLLKEDHHTEVEKVDRNETLYNVHYVVNGEHRQQRFDRELIDTLLINIESEPRYND